MVDSFNETLDSILEVYVDGTGRLDERMYTMSKEIADDYYHDLNYDLNWLANYYDVKDVIIFNKEGNVIEASNKAYIGRSARDIRGLTLLADLIEAKDEEMLREFSISHFLLLICLT